MKQIEFSQEIIEAAPELKVIQIEADVCNPPTSDLLWNEVLAESSRISSQYELSEINKRPAILANRAAYKTLGKEPNRYRPSSEALCRRAVNGKGLYRLTTLVDIINLVSMASGYSIGGFDADKIEGDLLCLGVGEEGEIFHGIGRGLLNIHCLPVYRDEKGGIGTPTSDEERTKLTETTTRLLMLVNMYGTEMLPEDVVGLTERLLRDFASAKDIRVQFLSARDMQ